MKNITWNLEATTGQVNPLQVFTAGNVETIISAIESEVSSVVCDVSTAKGRKEIASLAHKVSKSKIALDTLGKNLVADWKAKSKAVDSERKIIRDRLDALRDKTRQPLTEWEEQEKARIEAEELAAEIERAWELAIAHDIIFDREKEIAKKEEEERLAAEARRKQEEQERIAREQKEREERIAREAAEKAKREAEEKAALEKAMAEKAIAEAREREERAKLEKIEAARLAEESQAAAIAEERERAKREQHRANAERIRKEAEAKAEEEKRAANKTHRAKINRSILASLTKIGVADELAKSIITEAAKGNIKYLTIDY